MRRGGWAGAALVGVTAVLVVWNAGVILDALAYRRHVDGARAVLPAGWRPLMTGEPEAALAALRAAQTPGQRARAEAAGAQLRLDAGGRVVLGWPVGLDDETLDLATGCFAHARRRVSLFVWHFDISTGCL